MAQEQQKQQAPHPAMVAQEFMSRTDLKGKEVQIYAETFNWLQSILEGDLLLVPKEELQAFKDGIAHDPDAELEDVDSKTSDN